MGGGWCRVWGLGFRVWGSGLRVRGLGFSWGGRGRHKGSLRGCATCRTAGAWGLWFRKLGRGLRVCSLGSLLGRACLRSWAETCQAAHNVVVAICEEHRSVVQGLGVRV